MPIKVFIADDHTVLRDGLRVLLETDKNITVIGEAADGREAVRQVRELRPDIVIMDIAMPELNGIEATYQIADISPPVRVLILSMHFSKEHIFRAMQAGALGYLLKESAGQEVIKAVRKVYTGTRYMSQRITESMIDSYSHKDESVTGKNPLEQLSSREREVMQLVVEGKTSAMIAEILFLSPKTVETYRSRLMQKLGLRDLPGLMKFAIKHGIITLDA